MSGTGKKLAKQAAEMQSLKLEVVNEMKKSQAREFQAYATAGWIKARADFRAVLAILVLICWAVTQFVMN